jgi:hypothetical protein
MNQHRFCIVEREREREGRERGTYKKSDSIYTIASEMVYAVFQLHLQYT